MKTRIRQVTLCICLFVTTVVLSFAQSTTTAEIPLRKITLFSSGVAFFEYEGKVSGNEEIPLVFAPDAVNDVLKSLIIRDPQASGISVDYASEDTLARSLQSLRIDLSGNPEMADILAELRGAEITVQIPEPLTGRIVSVEQKTIRTQTDIHPETYISLSTQKGIRMLALSEISGLEFTDPAIEADLNRALDLIASFRDSNSRTLLVKLQGTSERLVSLGYIAPVPIWKVSYRLDISGKAPRFQGWAIIDNTGNTDWNDVELSLTSGRPVSFIQNLYPPYYFQRPTLPLAIAGTADAAVYDSGYGAEPEYEENESAVAPQNGIVHRMTKSALAAPVFGSDDATATAEQNLTGSDASGRNSAATTSEAGDLFQFTLKNKISLARQQSAMIPLTDTTIKAGKVSVFSANTTNVGKNEHPMFCLELENTTGMKLPAGPITVFDGDTYAGDALLEFLPEKERRLIAYGEDLSTTGTFSKETTNTISAVSIRKGLMTIHTQTAYSTTYTFRNADSEPRTLILEHPFIAGAELVSPAGYDEKTGRLWRFRVAIPAHAETGFTVKETLPGKQTVQLARLQLNNLLSYTSSREIPEEIKTVLTQAASLKKSVDDAKEKLTQLQTQKDDLVTGEERIRLNLEAAGNDTQQGRDYLQKLATSESAIEKLDQNIDAARKAVQDAQGAYDTYLSGLTLE